MVDSDLRDLFRQNSVDKQLVIQTDDGKIKITNTELHSQQFELTESLCSESQLRFGCCEASSIKFRISNVFEPLTGKWLEEYFFLDKNMDKPFRIGRHKVASDVPTADRTYRDVVAYDAIYDIINANVADWYNTVLPSKDSIITMKDFRKSFLAHFGLLEKEITLANDDMIIQKTIEPSELSGKDVLNAICEINGCFGHIARDGYFEYIYLKKDIKGLYPANDIFPSDDLYPREAKTDNIKKSHYISCKYEDFVTKEITKLQIRQTEDDIGAIVGNGDNTYIVEDNFLVYGKNPEDLGIIARNLFEAISDISYRPFSAECIGDPCLEIGDAVRLSTKHQLIESYILKRTLKGIQSLRDTYTANGKVEYAEKVNSLNRSIVQLRGKTNELVRNVEETRSEISDLEKDLSSRITQTVESITSEIVGLDGKINKVEQTVEGVTFTDENGQTKISGDSIKTGTIEGVTIQTEDLYIIKQLIMKAAQEGENRIALELEEVQGQTYPTLWIGGKDAKWAQLSTLNDIYFRGVNTWFANDVIFEKNVKVDKNIEIKGTEISFDTKSENAGIKAVAADSESHYFTMLDADKKTTRIGLPSSESYTSTTILRGNTVRLGSAGGEVVTSDERLKNSFKPLDEFDEVYMDIEPCAFKFNNGTSGRYHFGAKAGEVKQAFENHGFTTKDFGGFVQMTDSPDNEDYSGVDDPMGLIYTEFTMWNMHMVQKLNKKVAEQQAEIDSLKETVFFLMERLGV